MRFPLLTSVSLALATLAMSGSRANDYLTKDGQLAAPLKVVQLQGGFAGFTGIQFTIAPDGSWTTASLFNDKVTPKSKGKLSEKDLAKLAAALERFALARLPAKSGTTPGANPHTISIEFGKATFSLVGRVPPKLDEKNPTASVESRFAGILTEVVGLLAPQPKEK